MSKRPVVSSRINKNQLNPVFHLQTKKEDADSLSLNLIKQARTSGILNLAGRGLANGELKFLNYSFMVLRSWYCILAVLESVQLFVTFVLLSFFMVLCQ